MRIPFSASFKLRFKHGAKRRVKKSTAVGLITILIISTFLPILGFITPGLSPVQAASDWWNEDYRYRQIIEINATSAQTNAYYQLQLDTSDVTRFKGDCTDLRFLTQSGQEIPYHIVSGCTTSNTQVQLLFASLAQGNQDIIVYYGNPRATTTAIQEPFNNPAAGVTTNTQPEQSSPAPVVHWKFDEGYGSTINSSTSTNYPGTINGATWQQEDMCPSGKCLYFDGVDDYVDMGDVKEISQSGTYTISAWLRPTQAIDGYWIGQGGVSGGWAISRNASGSITFLSKQANNNNAIIAYNTSSSNTLLDLWTHVSVIATIDTVDLANNNVQMYFNGSEQSVGINRNALPVLPNTKFRVGSRGNTLAPLTFYSGYIDDPKIYSYPRTQQQIQQDYLRGIQSLNQQQANLSNGLIGHWKMDESSWNGTTGEVKDSSGNNHHGQAMNGSVVGPGKYGNGGSFDGIDDYASLPELGITGPGKQHATVASWVKPNTSGYGTVFNYGIDSIRLSLDYQNKPYCYIRVSDSTLKRATSSIAIPVGVWSNIGCSYDGNNIRVWVDGNEVASMAQTGDLINAPGPTGYTLGNAILWPDLAQVDFFNGAIDNTRVYNQSLSPTEISKLYSQSPRPIVQYDFEQNAGSTIYDKSGNGNHATWYGAGKHYGQGRVGQGALVDENGSYAIVNNTQVSYSPSFTWGVWAHRTKDMVNSYPIIMGASNPHISYAIRSQTNGNTVTFEYGVPPYNGDSGGGFGVNYFNLSCGSNFPVGAWSYFSVAYDGSNIIFYQDGKVCGQTIAPVILNPNNFDLRLGHQSRPYEGALDEVKIYNYARTPAQILQDMQSSAPNEVNPIGHWKFDENQGTIAKNSSLVGSSLNGALVGMASPPTSISGWTGEGVNKNALNFDGADDYIRVSNTPEIDLAGGSLAFSAWVKLNTYQNGYLLAKRNGEIQQYAVYLYGGGDAISLYMWGSNSSISGKLSKIPLHEWTHLVITYDAQSKVGYIYANGIDITTDKTADPIPSTTNSDLYIGARGDGGAGVSYYIDGSIDELKIYNTALTPQQIAVDYNKSSAGVFGASSTEPTTSQSGSPATQPSQSQNSKYCVPGSTDYCTKPVLEYNFEQGSDVTVPDTSGRNNDGVWQGIGDKYGPGKNGRAGLFNGLNSKIVSTVEPSGVSNQPHSFTVSGYINPQIGQTGSAMFISPDAAGGDLFLYYDEVNQRIRLNIASDTDINNRVLNTAINSTPLNKWTHFTLSIDGQLVKMYINGILSNSSEETLPIAPWASNWSFGARHNSTHWFKGMLDDLRIYNYTRTPAQVAWDYNNGGPIAHYKMDECSGTTIHDSSGNNFNGDLTLGPLGATSPGTCTTTNTAWSLGKMGKYNGSISLDGIDDTVDVVDNPALNIVNDLTLSAWINPSSIESFINNYAEIITKRINGAYVPYELKLSQTGSINFNWYSPSEGWKSLATQRDVVASNRWNHIVVTRNALDIRIYINGKLAKVGPNSMDVAGNTGKLRIGGPLTPYYSAFPGLIDDVQIYNYALTQKQIDTLYNGGAVRWGQ